jgi:hypothetical protein
MLAVEDQEYEHEELEDSLTYDILEHGLGYDVIITLMGCTFQEALCGGLCC